MLNHHQVPATFSHNGERLGIGTFAVKIEVVGPGWGLGRPADIQVLLEDTVTHINQLLRNPFGDTIIVVPASPDDAVPMT